MEELRHSALARFETLLALWALALGTACSRPPLSLPSNPAAHAGSNLLRSDYAGSKACEPCHAELYEALKASPMHRMTRAVETTSVGALFDGRTFAFKGDVATLERHDEKPFVRLASERGTSLFRVTKVIGGRYREDFVGAEVDPEEPFGRTLGLESVLPVSSVLFDQSLRYKGYSVMLPERARLEAGPVWQETCIFCHNTIPTLTTLYDDLYGPGAPSYQGSASTELGPAQAFRYVIDDAEGLNRALKSELAGLGVSAALPDDTRAALKAAIAATRDRLGEQQLVELGVGCEACHGGSRAHAEAPTRVRPTFALESELLHVVAPQGGTPTSAQDINRTCSKCHTVLFSRYPYTWEGGGRRDHPGGSTTNSGEARDFLLGGCSSALHCANCHDPHGRDEAEHLASLGAEPGNRLCTTCHSRLAEPGALRAHSHHAAGSAGSFCVNCHMPKKNMGLAYELTRYHRIGSPTDPVRVENDRPLECALCHADRSVDQIVSTMEKWWGGHYDRKKLARLYGPDLTKNPIVLTLAFGKPHEQAVAMSVAEKQRVPGTTELIVDQLGNEYPLVRYYARHALERRFNQALGLDMSQSGPELLRAGKAWLAARPAPAGPRTPAPAGPSSPASASPNTSPR